MVEILTYLGEIKSFSSYPLDDWTLLEGRGVSNGYPRSSCLTCANEFSRQPEKIILGTQIVRLCEPQVNDLFQSFPS